MNMKTTKPKKNGPMADWAKEWTEEMTPLRTMNVPRMTSRKVRTMSTMFHTLNMRIFSWIITECRKAVAASQGISEAFSTGSQPQ